MKKRVILLYFILAAGLLLLSPPHSSGALFGWRTDDLLEEGTAFMQGGNYGEALKKFSEALKLSPEDKKCLYNAGLAAYMAGNFNMAARSWEELLGLEPGDWKVRAKLIQTYQSLGDLKARDKNRDILLAMRGKGGDKELARAEEYCRDQFSAGGRKVMAYERFEFAVEQAVLYKFFIFKPNTQAVDYTISLGSYESATKAARGRKEIGPKERIYHVDAYYQNGRHEAFAFYKKPPSYDYVRKVVGLILDKRMKPVDDLDQEE